MTLALVALAALITAIFTGLGAAPFLFGRRPGPYGRGLAHGAAAGLMLAASIGLISEGFETGQIRCVAGLALGAGLMMAGHWLMARHNHHLQLTDLSGADSLKALTVLGAMTLHSVAEGVGVGVAFGDAAELGWAVTAAIALHNIPEGLAIALVMVPQGMGVVRAAGWGVFSSLPQPLLAAPAFLFVTAFLPVLPLGLGFAAGAMIWMVSRELLPDAFAMAGPGPTTASLTAGLVAMLALQALMPGL